MELTNLNKISDMYEQEIKAMKEYYDFIEDSTEPETLKYYQEFIEELEMLKRWHDEMLFRASL